MENWFDIVEPHNDIKEGEFDESVFAAKLDEVVAETAPPDYSDPYMFFKKTYFTSGITSLLKKVNRKLTKGRGSGVIEIKTPFGGGKTHALASVYHYIQNGQKLKSALPEGLDPLESNIGVIVGTALNPLEGRQAGGLEIKTLWGDIAYQLAGKEGYEFFKRNDEEKIAPGKDKLSKFLKERQPFVLLFDEILEYIIKAKGVQYQDTSLATQTYAFVQELTEVVSSLERGMMIVTLPSSVIEDPSEKSGEALRRLEKIFGRIEAFETPVEGEEVYSVISKRLFQRTMDEGKKDRIIHDYFELYQQNKEELPQKARDVNLKSKMELAYPFHPDVIDILFEKWGTFTSFQRTRGVLRLLANIIEDLYRREKNIDVILPSDINMENPSIRREFISHIGEEYESVIGSDILDKSKEMDKENRNWKHLAERISTTIFFHSFTATSYEQGLGLPYIKLDTLHLEMLPSMVTEVLQKLSNTLWYLNEKNNRYYFSKIPNLNRMIMDKKELFSESYLEELKEIVKRKSGRAFSVYVWPEKSEDIPDNQELKLIILHPNYNGGDVKSWINKRGNNFRIYKNTLIFAISEPSAHANLKEGIKTYMALKEIKKEIEGEDNESLKEKIPEIKERMKKIERDFSYNLRRMYNTLQVGEETIELGQPSVTEETLSGWYRNELEYREKIVNKMHYKVLVERFLKGTQIPTKALLEQFYKDESLFMLGKPEVLVDAIRRGVKEGAFCLALVEDGEIDENTFKFETDLSSGDITFYESENLIPKDTCVRYRQDIGQKESEVGEAEGKLERKSEPTPKPPERDEKGKESRPEVPQNYTKVSLEIEDIPSSNLADLNRGVLRPIIQEIGHFNIEIGLDISDDEGIPKETLDEIKENIKKIGGKMKREEIE